MVAYVAAVLGGLVLLVWSSDRFVDGAAGAARSLGVSPFLVGMLVIGFGTSAPEIIVSAISAANAVPGIALGNAWGSNIANIALILGVSALVRPIRVASKVRSTEVPVLIGATVVSGIIIANRLISRWEGLALLCAMTTLIAWSIHRGKNTREEVSAESDTPEDRSNVGNIVWVIVGLAILVGSSRVLVWGAVGIATAAGVSDLVIGLTIIAVGTSLPELASSLVAARKGETELVFGNVIGSNLFNTLVVVGIAGLIHPISVETDVLWRDLPVMAGLTLALLLTGFARDGGPGFIRRWEGFLLLLGYAGYTAWVAISAL